MIPCRVGGHLHDRQRSTVGTLSDERASPGCGVVSTYDRIITHEGLHAHRIVERGPEAEAKIRRA
eukprot:8332-Eustigmatos_ZCMA.PRE.1